MLGTWGGGHAERDWRQPGAAFARMMDTLGFVQLWADDLFEWSTDLEGIPLIGSGRDWEAARANLRTRLRLADTPRHQRNFLLHSHAGAIGLPVFADTPVNVVVTIGTPPRAEVREAGRLGLARGNIRAWIHISDDTWDTWGALGELGDGTLRATWKWPFVVRTMDVPGCVDVRLHGIGHSGLLYTPTVEAWERTGVFPVLREVTAAATALGLMSPGAPAAATKGWRAWAAERLRQALARRQAGK